MIQAMAPSAMLAILRLSPSRCLVCMYLLYKGLTGAGLAWLPRPPRAPSPAAFPEPQATCTRRLDQEPPLCPSKEGKRPRQLSGLDGCGGLQVRATSHPLTTRDQQGRQQADTPLLGCKGGPESNARAVYTQLKERA